MKFYKSVLILSLLLISQTQFAQINFPKAQLNNLTNKALTNINIKENIILKQSDSEMPGGKLIEFFKTRQKVMEMNFKNMALHGGKSSDTLIIGALMNDSLHITGNYTYTGTILVVNNGKLVIENADALINGDVYVSGNGAKVIAPIHIMTVAIFVFFFYPLFHDGCPSVCNLLDNFQFLQHLSVLH